MIIIIHYIKSETWPSCCVSGLSSVFVVVVVLFAFVFFLKEFFFFILVFFILCLRLLQLKS